MTDDAPTVEAAREHLLKTWPEFFEALVSGAKQFEIRKDDRGYRVGDVLRLREWNPLTQEWTGREVKRCVSYIYSGAWAAPGFVVMSFAAVRSDADPRTTFKAGADWLRNRSESDSPNEADLDAAYAAYLASRSAGQETK